MEFSVADAKNKLPELIKAVEDGEPGTICRRGVPVVDILRTKKPIRKKRILGSLRGQIKILDPDWWKPMTDSESDRRPRGSHPALHGRSRLPHVRALPPSQRPF